MNTNYILAKVSEIFNFFLCLEFAVTMYLFYCDTAFEVATYKLKFAVNTYLYLTSVSKIGIFATSKKGLTCSFKYKIYLRINKNSMLILSCHREMKDTHLNC